MIIDSPQKKIKNNPISMPKKIWTLFVILLVLAIGLIAGAVLGFYGTFYLCTVYDSYYPPSSSGGGMGVIGWIYILISIPIGAMIGGIISLLIYNKISK